ncbi:glycosyltransferase family 2 protein [Fontisubflavum oceani]|uniref:glycosyltransferase family 2 protein n=1 Tax=Fontisubflavum oceani TaxID=2978973 RepID=UPI0025B43FB3|nr:glycosyltransferase family 2 protein [Fontisubflavum oceani]WJY20957.1 glycosyltransferase family 2 protein [Fontisubflavum oceani]
MKISVITAVYNSETTVAEAIASVASQTYPDVEHLIIEGKSKDGSLATIETASHDRMVLVSEQDTGIYDALNKGISKATGDVVGFLHSDDFLAHPDVLARIAAAFEDPTVEAVFSDLDYVAQSDTSRIVRRWATGPFARERLKRGWMPAHPTLYLRRSVYERIGMFDTGFQIAADYDFILRYFSQLSARSVYIPEVLYKMRLGGESNRDFGRIKRKSLEDYRAIRRNGVGGPMTLAIKNLSKLGQFLPR